MRWGDKKLSPHEPTVEGLMPWTSRSATEVREAVWRRIAMRGIDECWLWTGTRDRKGYGRFWQDGAVRRVTRCLFWDVHGYLPPVVRHTCDNPPCCNPAHLLPGTHREN